MEIKLLDANAINSFVSNFALVIAPIIAGVLYSACGVLIIFVANAISFILSAISEMFINIPKLNKEKMGLYVKSYFNDLVEGLKITVKVKTIFSVMFLALIANFALNPITNVGFVYIVKQVFNCSSAQLGFFQGIMLIGMLIAPIVSTTLLKGKSIKKIISYNMLLSGAVIAISAFVASSSYTGLFNNNTVPYIINFSSIHCCIYFSNKYISFKIVSKRSSYRDVMKSRGCVKYYSSSNDTFGTDVFWSPI